jgi:UDPglucose 6-dehydrogenase
MSQISVVGTGYVGLTTGVCFAHLGHTVCCIDVDREKVDSLKAGRPPIFEPGIEELLQDAARAGTLTFTDDYDKGLHGTDFVFIAVGTPPAEDGRSAELRYVHGAAGQIARSLQAPAVIVNKSTSPIGTADGIRRILEENNPHLSPWIVVSNPEFLREGRAVEDCLHPARVVLGAQKVGDCERVADLYRSFGCPIIETNLHTAEMIKYASNAFLATKISFINEVARMCDALGADVATVADGMGLDERIGREFLNAGLGYGGSCFPKDVAALTHMAAEAGLHPQLLKAVVDINDDQRRWAIEILDRELDGLTGRTLAIWGLTFKPDTDDLRSAPALDIAARLLERGAQLRTYDPVIAKPDLKATPCHSSSEAAKGADAVLIATDWAEFQGADWAEVASAMRGRLIFDGRNCIDPAAVTRAGLRYVGVGRRPNAESVRGEAGFAGKARAAVTSTT